MDTRRVAARNQFRLAASVSAPARASGGQLFALYVAIPTLGVVLGAAVVALGRNRRSFDAAFDGFARGVVPALVALRVAPDVYREAGVPGVALIALGYAAAWALGHRHVRRPRALAMVVVGSLFLHALVDGASLAVAIRSTDAALARSGLAIGLFAHRVPEGVFVASALLPMLGSKRTFAIACALATTTALAAFAGDAFLSRAHGLALHALVALGMGVIVRVSLQKSARSTGWAGAAFRAIGVAVGLAAALL